MVRVLLHFPHGLGDVIQFSVVLKHLAKYRPDWQVTVRCGRGKHSALVGQCARVSHDQEEAPPGPYDTEATLGWYENYSAFEDRPNSKITNCLSEVFGIAYDPKLARYQVTITEEARQRARDYLLSIGAKPIWDGRKFQAVLLHYEGNTSTWKKNLKHWQAKTFCERVLALGRVPVLLDWDGRSPLPNQKTIFCPPTGKGDIWGGFGSGDASTIAALCELCEAYLGIDSGPGKIASATATPALIAWKEHHPIQFHDPAPNTTHLIPDNWRGIPPAANRPGVQAYFEKHYLHRVYHGDFGLVEEACSWLAEVLGGTAQEGTMRKVFVCPNGIGDVLWAFHKIEAVAGGEPIELILAGDPRRDIDWRAVPFVKRFPFVERVTVLDMPILLGERDEDKNDARGRYRYYPDGERSGFHYLVPNGALEKGVRLEDWLPDQPINWNVVDQFDWTSTDKGDLLGRSLHPFMCFYLGPESGNVDEGHNRGFLWEPRQWIELGLALREKGFKIAVVGASYDRSYWERYVEPGVRQAAMKWHDFIGKLEIGETMALIRKARAFVSYQCGLGIFAHYLGQRVVMWWRPDGNSIHPERMVAFDDRMKDAWINPRYADRYLGCLYQRESVADILTEMDRRGWLTV